MSKFSFVGPYGDDPTVGHLSTPITTSMITRTLLGNLPAYRPGLSSLLRGLEVGMAHGYFFSMINGNFLKNPNIQETIEGRFPNKYFDPNIKSKYKLFMLNNKIEDGFLIINY